MRPALKENERNFSIFSELIRKESREEIELLSDFVRILIRYHLGITGLEVDKEELQEYLGDTACAIVRFSKEYGISTFWELARILEEELLLETSSI